MTFSTPQTPEDWQEYNELRYRVLRQPWNQPRGSELLPDDHSSHNLMLRNDEGVLVAVGRVHFNSPQEAQVRSMAVDAQYRNNNYGAMVLRALEEYAWSKGAKYVVLDARERALPFYERNGYRIIELSYLLFGEIQHHRMRKEAPTT